MITLEAGAAVVVPVPPAPPTCVPSEKCAENPNALPGAAPDNSPNERRNVLPTLLVSPRASAKPVEADSSKREEARKVDGSNAPLAMGQSKFVGEAVGDRLAARARTFLSSSSTRLPRTSKSSRGYGVDGYCAVGCAVGRVHGAAVGGTVGPDGNDVGVAEGRDDGAADGLGFGSTIGVSVGVGVGRGVGTGVGRGLGAPDGSGVGAAEGVWLGDLADLDETRECEERIAGAAEGRLEGTAVGDTVGPDGNDVGVAEGRDDGAADGLGLGSMVGVDDGFNDPVGLAVGVRGAGGTASAERNCGGCCPSAGDIEKSERLRVGCTTGL